MTTDPGRFPRGSLEFDRAAFFTDAVFAIALTILVVGIAVPRVSAARLPHELGGLESQIISFFVGFAVIGYYWLAHHRFFKHLDAIDQGFLVANLTYLASIAFVPFPTALVGEHSGAPIAVVIFAITISAASLLEAMLLVRAYRSKLFRIEVSSRVFRFALLASLIPVAVFLVSIPIAYADTTLAMLSWLLVLVVERVIVRWRPPESAAQLDI
jgi:uncharacterized membrane protein